VNLSKTKLMIGGERCNTKKSVGKWPCAVCGKAVGSNSIRCTDCQQWLHNRCSSVKGSLCKASKSFVCSVCLCSTDNEIESSVDIVDGSSVEIVDEFCYPGDMLSVDVDADAAVTARIHSGWFKFRSLASFLTDKDVSFLLRGKVYDACIQS